MVNIQGLDHPFFQYNQLSGAGCGMCRVFVAALVKDDPDGFLISLGTWIGGTYPGPASGFV
jgi:hypothetical protein